MCLKKFLPGLSSNSHVAYNELIEHVKSNLYSGSYELHKSLADGLCLIQSMGVIVDKQCVISAIERGTLAHFSK